MLSGINKKCLKCKRECKQFAQVKILYCPKFEPIEENANENVFKTKKRRSKSK